MGKRRGHGEGSIHQRASDGLWCCTVDLGRDANGKRRRHSIYGKTRKEVADKLKALHRDLAAGINLTPEQYTVAQFLDRWLNEVIIHRSPRTQESYKSTIKRNIVPYVGSQKLQKLRPEHVQAMVNALAKTSLKPRTIEYAALVLSRGMNQAKRWGYITKNPVDDVELPKVRKLRVMPADENQARSLLKAVAGHRYEALYWVVLFLGLRRGEVLALRLTDVDLEKLTLTVDGSLQRVNGKLVRADTKTESSRRTLPIPAPLAKILTEHLQHREADRIKAGDDWVDSELLFVSTRGTPIEPRNLLRHFKAALVEAGLPESTRFHDLRHWCASLLIAYGVHAKAIQAILGHANIQMTLDVYGHLLPTVLQDAIDHMSALAPPEEPKDEGEEDQETGGETE